jgi:ParB-like chromosome segregation protein Spo0J
MKKEKTQLQVELLETEKLIPHLTNPKQHPAEQVAQIAASIQAFGFLDPIGIDEDNTILEGHGRLLAAQKLGLKCVPVIRLSHLSKAERKAYALAHNKLTLNSGWDVDLLRLELEALKELQFENLDLTGFRPVEIEILFTPPSIPDSEPELDERLVGKKEAQPRHVTCPSCATVFYV